MSIFEDEDFWKELDTLVKVLRRIVAGLVVCTLFAAVVPLPLASYSTLTSYMIKQTVRTMLPEGVEVMPISWFQPFTTYIIVSLMFGFLLSFPYTALQIYRYLKPIFKGSSITQKVWHNIITVTALYVFGVAYGWFFVAPMNIKALTMFNQVVELPQKYDFAGFLELVNLTLIICGFAFTAPFWLYILAKAGIIKRNWLKGKRRLLYGSLIIALSIFDPDPYIFTETFLGLPLIIMFEIAQWKVKHERKKE